MAVALGAPHHSVMRVLARSCGNRCGWAHSRRAARCSVLVRSFWTLPFSSLNSMLSAVFAPCRPIIAVARRVLAGERVHHHHGGLRTGLSAGHALVHSLGSVSRGMAPVWASRHARTPAVCTARRQESRSRSYGGSCSRCPWSILPVGWPWGLPSGAFAGVAFAAIARRAAHGRATAPTAGGHHRHGSSQDRKAPLRAVKFVVSFVIASFPIMVAAQPAAKQPTGARSQNAPRAAGRGALASRSQSCGTTSCPGLKPAQ